MSSPGAQSAASPRTSVPAISIIIPSFNQASSLRETLAALNHQSTSADDFEVLVVDDGSTDNPQDVIASLATDFQCRLLRQDNRGASAARNWGATYATADILLFLDADMIAHQNLIDAHLKSHSAGERILVAGRRRPWPPAQTTLFSRIIDIDSNVPNTGGRASSFSFGEALSCNLSIKAHDFRAIGGFDEGLPRWHDVEMAHRAEEQGLDLIYNPAAVAYHNHPMTFEEYCNKTHRHHQFAALLLFSHPELQGCFFYLLDKEPVDWHCDSLGLIGRKVARRLLALKPVLRAMEAVVALLESKWPSPNLLRPLYWKVLGSYELRGFREGLRRYGQPQPTGKAGR